MPVLSPLGLHPAHPFPKILNKSLNLVVVLKGKTAIGRSGYLALVRAPRSLPRIIQLPKKVSGREQALDFLSSDLSEFVATMFPAIPVNRPYQSRDRRNSVWITATREVDKHAMYITYLLFYTGDASSRIK